MNDSVRSPSAANLFRIFLLLLIPNSPLFAECPTCANNYTPIPGHGGTSETPPRRKITVRIDSSWDSSPGQTDAAIWNAVTCANGRWNDATDASGNKTGYKLEMDQTGQQGTPADITIKKEDIEGFAYADINSGGPSIVTLDPTNASQTAENLCGRVSHEIGHAFGLNSAAFCSSSSVMTTSATDGARTVNTPTAQDVVSANQVFAGSSGTCSQDWRTQDTTDTPPPSCDPPVGCALWDYEACECISGSGGGCTAGGCSCGAECMPNGQCGPSTFECSPILIAIGQNSQYSLTSPEGGVWFDLNADGIRERIAWTEAGEDIAFLVRDRDGNGKVDDGSELFGNHSVVPSGERVTNGFEALAYYDQASNGGNGDGVISAEDAVWSELRLWLDRNHNGISEREELFELHDYDVRSISLDFKVTNRSDAHGNVFRLKAPCRIGPGVRMGYDVYFSAKPQRKPY